MIGIPVIGFILAGRQERRLGGVDKAFIGLAGRPLISRVDRLATALTEPGAMAAYAASRSRPHPVVALWSRGSLEALLSLIVQSDVRRLKTLLPVIGGVAVGFPADPIDPFFNVNTHDDLGNHPPRAVFRLT